MVFPNGYLDLMSYIDSETLFKHQNWVTGEKSILELPNGLKKFDHNQLEHQAPCR